MSGNRDEHQGNAAATRKGRRAARCSAHRELEPVTITMTRRDWKLLTDYFEGDVEAMGGSAPQDQDRARRIQDWIRHRMVKGNSLKSAPNTQAQRPE